jgi:hypothetical protein
MRATSVEALRAALSEADFPASKGVLVDQARRAGADEQTVQALQAIPPVEYTNLDEVSASVPMEHDRSEASTPIGEELGENRGS